MCKARHDRQEQLALAVEGVDALLLKVAFHAMLFELADGGQAVHGVSGEAADGLGHDQVDLSGQRVSNHLIEAIPVAGIQAADAFVYLNAVFDTMKIGLLRHIMPGKGHISWAFAVQSSPFGGTVNSLFPLFSFVYLECRAESTYPPLD